MPRSPERPRRTFERPVPHALGDLGSVGRVVAGGERLVERERVQDHRVVERAHEAVHLQRNTDFLRSNDFCTL